jgi:hypothetical protein
MKDNKEPSYNFICFTNLSYEFDIIEKTEIEKKIKRQLKYYKLEEYNQEIVDYIRRIKNDLYSEISLTTKSKYFHKSKSNYADLADFDFEQMVIDYNGKYNKIDKNELVGMINFAIYLFHMR